MELFVTFIESLYLFYMFNLFKTTYTINHPFEKNIINNLGNYFKHPISNSVYENKICDFGKLSIKLFIGYLFIRFYIKKNSLININLLKKINLSVMLTTFILSLSNMNALIYLIPFFITDNYFFNI